MKAMNDLTLMRNSNKTRVGLIFTVLILTNCNTNCPTTVQYCKNMAFVQKYVSLYSPGDQQLAELLIHKDTQFVLLAQHTNKKKAHDTSKIPLFLHLCLEM